MLGQNTPEAARLRARALPLPTYLGAAPGAGAGHPAGIDRLPGPSLGGAAGGVNTCGRVAAIDGTLLRVRGGEWHTKDRAARIAAPLVYRYGGGLTPERLARVGLRLEVAPGRDRRGLHLVTARRGAYPHTDAGTEVRRVFHQLRSHAVEDGNGGLKGLFGCGDRGPTCGRMPTRRFVLGGRPRLLTRPAPPPRAWCAPQRTARRPQALPPHRLTIYARASSSSPARAERRLS